ncbi:uncharacterized protein SCHCODRAFT_01172077 [Schizophyllum commune H4-8]|nr:uncharacterized protein SCHCODRAFT_01172077 [Schizophyllum commune H4-8]KAI5891033.1 hypothetical protein SCHCODRAFT_01172077 [Schizophyllum commune H4-8]
MNRECTNLRDRQGDAQLRRDATAQMGDGKEGEGTSSVGVAGSPADFQGKGESVWAGGPQDDLAVKQDMIPRRMPYAPGLWCILHVCLSGWPSEVVSAGRLKRLPPNFLGNCLGGEAHIQRVIMIIRTISRVIAPLTVGPSSPELQDVRVLNVFDDAVYEGPPGSTIRAHGNSLARDALIRPGMTVEICALQKKHPLYCDIPLASRPRGPKFRPYTVFQAMAIRNAVRGLHSIFKKPCAKALHAFPTPYHYVVSPALGYSPRHERAAPVIPITPELAPAHHDCKDPASIDTPQILRVLPTQPQPNAPQATNSPSRPLGQFNFYPPLLTDGELEWHIWDAPPSIANGSSFTDISIAYFPIHTLTIYIPHLADWQWRAWGPLVVRRPDGQYLRIADVLGAVHEYLHTPLTVADVAELRIARRTRDVGGTWARNAGEAWSWEAEVMQFMLNRIEKAGPEEVGVVPRRVDMLAGKLWFDRLAQALGHGQHAEMTLTFKDG